MNYSWKLGKRSDDEKVGVNVDGDGRLFKGVKRKLFPQVPDLTDDTLDKNQLTESFK